MTAELFLMVVCLLALKYTLELAGTVRPVRRVAADQLRRWLTVLDTPRVYVSAGLVVALVGWVSDRRWAGWVLLAGVALSQVGVYVAGSRAARRQLLHGSR